MGFIIIIDFHHLKMIILSTYKTNFQTDVLIMLSIRYDGRYQNASHNQIVLK